MSLKTAFLTTTALLALTGVARADGVLNLYVWSDSIAPELIAKFEAERSEERRVGKECA